MKGKINSYKDLLVWQRSMSLVEDVYKICEELPNSEMYGLTAQMKRSVISVPSNIAEGWGRKSTNAYTNHLRIALGSLYEIETQVEIARRMYSIQNPESAIAKIEEIGKMLNSLIKKLKLAKS